VTSEFIPVRVHVKEQKKMFDRFKAVWTPTVLVMDAAGNEVHRIEGFLPTEDFLAQLDIGLAKLAFQKEEYEEAERHYRHVCDDLGHTGAAAEACYWAGAARYKATHSSEALRETRKILEERFPNSEWARRASVWSG
jgi:predicted ATPase